MIDTLRTGCLLFALCCLMVPAEADGQLRRGRQVATPSTGWAPVWIGPRAGYDRNARGEVFGVHAHLPILRSGRLELMPTADVTFVTGSREYQYGVELVVVTGGPDGGIYAGAGAGYRHTVFDTTPGDPRRRVFGYTLVGGARMGGSGPFQTQFEIRSVYLQDLDYRPTIVSLGIAFPISGARSVF